VLAFNLRTFGDDFKSKILGIKPLASLSSWSVGVSPREPCSVRDKAITVAKNEVVFFKGIISKDLRFFSSLHFLSHFQFFLSVQKHSGSVFYVSLEALGNRQAEMREGFWLLHYLCGFSFLYNRAVFSVACNDNVDIFSFSSLLKEIAFTSCSKLAKELFNHAGSAFWSCM